MPAPAGRTSTASTGRRRRGGPGARAAAPGEHRRDAERRGSRPRTSAPAPSAHEQHPRERRTRRTALAISGPSATPSPRAPIIRPVSRVAAAELLGDEHRQQPDDAGAHRERRLRREQRQQHRVAPGVDRAPRACRRSAACGARVGRASAAPASAAGSARSRPPATTNEPAFAMNDDVAAEHAGDHAADRRADGEHRPPQRAEQHARLRELGGRAGEVGQRRLRRRADERTERGDRRTGRGSPIQSVPIDPTSSSPDRGDRLHHRHGAR